MVEEDEAAVQAAGGGLGAKTLIGLLPVRAAQRRLGLDRGSGEIPVSYTHLRARETREAGGWRRGG